MSIKAQFISTDLLSKSFNTSLSVFSFYQCFE